MGTHDKAADADVQPVDVEIVHIRGSGGVIWPMSLPLHEGVADQVAKGEAVRVNADGSPWEPSDDDPVLVHEHERDRLEREHLAGLEYARLKHENPDADLIELRDEAADTVGDVIPDAAPTGKPKPAESKAVWVAYAEANSDLSYDEAEGMSKADLLRHFS